MRAALVSIAVLCAACPYDGREIVDGVPPNGDGREPDALPTTCDAEGETACDGRLRKVCGPDHQWDAAQETKCDFVCAAGECVAASNVPTADVGLCEGAALHPLTPTAGFVTITEPVTNQIEIQCTLGCGDANVLTATRVAGTPGLAWFCLSEVTIPAGMSIGLPPSGGPNEAIAFIVDGPVAIAGDIQFDGGNGNLGVTGEGAPGGEDGGDFQTTDSAAGLPGDGPCPGTGGGLGGGGTQAGAAGGGGGGYSESGAPGGDGRSPNNTQVGTGGSGGGTCGTIELEPLVGGSGGGGGADGNCGADCGWPGGGGGGAIQISSRTSIAISGAIFARGGDGFGVGVAFGGEGGGGGGGAGGAVLLEAPQVSVAGAIDVDGGAGGVSIAGAGGSGASASTGPSAGASGTAGAQGGAGGGGSGGRVRIRAAAPLCTGVTPLIACSAGTLQ